MGEVVRTSLHVILMLMGSFCTCFGCNGESEEAMFCQDNWGSRWCPSINSYVIAEPILTLHVQCLPNGLSTTWEADVSKLADQREITLKTFYECTYANGTGTYSGYSRNIDTYRSYNGSFNVTFDDEELKQNLATYGGSCIVKGCHYNIRPYLEYYTNPAQMCTYRPESSISQTDLISDVSTPPTSTPTTDAEETSSGNPQTTSTPTTDAEETSSGNPQTTSATPLTGILGNITQTSVTPFPTTDAKELSTAEVFMTIASTNSTLNGRTSGSTTIIVTVGIILFSLTTLFVSALLCSFLCICSKKRSLKFKYLGNILHVDSEKIDPYFAPIRVESYIKKCESVDSILDSLNQRNDELSKCKFALQVDTNTPNVPQQSGLTSFVPKPLPLHSSDNQNSANTYTLLPCQGIHTITDSPGKDSVAIIMECSRDEEQAMESSDLQFKEHRICSYSSNSTMDFQSDADYKDPVKNEPLNNSLNENRDGNSSVQDDRIVLTFSPPDDNNSELIIMQKSNSSVQPQLTINPHHFDPL